MITIDEALQGIQDEFIDNCIFEDIELYYKLHEVKDKDLIQHCLIMAEQLRQDYQNYYQIKV
jgi:hypothetical protein